MSTDDHLFFDPGHRDARAAAAKIAEAVDGRFLDNQTGMGVSVDLGAVEQGAFLVGPVWENTPIEPIDPEDPTDREIFDDLPLLWSMRTGPSGDEAFARAAAREVFDRLAASCLGWPLVLAHHFSELVATYDVERGVREFPPGTRSDGTDEHLWRWTERDA